ncbi:angiopoietin-1 receptor-like isoform X2 [Amphiura filiformis]|uniref:angiopoietin-1 receptor-like isoform X1 n=1 Tax=Amphiura filiformis TaxID=82378 RepID=UPI003B218430
MPDPVGCSCMTGWMGTECNQECPAGSYGAGCTQFCKCQSGSCDRFTGRCDDGICLSGWSGDNCQIPTDTCPVGYYGDECLDKCNCNNCDKTTGCINSLCYTGSWGEQCENQCNNCYNCDKTTACMNSVCHPGYWGEQCQLQCNSNCNNCDKSTGCMNSQCHTGYWGEQCDTECNCLNGGVCDKETGKLCNDDFTTLTVLEITTQTRPAGMLKTLGLTTKSSGVPGPPTNVTAILGVTSITLEWNEPVDSNGDISFYHVAYRAFGDTSFANFSQDVRENINTHHTFILRALQPATIYEVYVSAENTFGKGESTYRRFETFKEKMDVKGPVMSSSSTGIAAGASVAVIVIVAVVVFCVIKRRKEQNKSSSLKQPVNEGNLFENQAFNPDTGAYEDLDLDDQEYEEVTSSQWDIAWEDLNLSGQILGKGNFGDVQMAKVKIRNKWIMAAVKTLKHGTPESERSLFEEEFNTMTKIGHHPNVVNILGSCEHAGSFYVVLEYVHHGNLRKFLRKCRKESKEAAKRGQTVTDVSPDQLLNFAIGVAKAMKHISDCGIIHRDLAARNVLVGRGYTPKVSDFGMSREEDVYVQASSRRVPTRWLSIESMTKKMYSTKSDVWSFGILLWEIATFGGTPYSDMKTSNLAYRLTDGYRMPKPENCEGDMYELMLQCWQEDPDARPTFKDIVRTLTDMAAQDKIYMSTHFYENHKYAAISLEKDDK